MNIEIPETSLVLTIYGFSGKASNKDYSGTAFQLMDKMWKVVKSNELKNKGLNVWVYDSNEQVFAGVELEELPMGDTILERKTISLARYARYKHIGSYARIKQAGQEMTNSLKNMGYETSLPYIEIYGHWTNDESRLETDLLVCLK